MAQQTKKKWTVFFIIKAGKASAKNVIIMLNEIRSIKQKETHSVIICISNYKEDLQAILLGDERELIPAERSNQLLTTAFLSMVPDTASDRKFESRFDVIDDNEKFDITNPNYLKKYFKEKILQPHQAIHYML